MRTYIEKEIQELKERALSTTIAFTKGDGWKTPTSSMRKAVEEYFDATHANTGMSMEGVYLNRKITAGELVIELISRLDTRRLRKAEKGMLEIASEVPSRLLRDEQEWNCSLSSGMT